MAKGSGTTRSSSSGNPRGLGVGNSGTLQKLSEAQAKADSKEARNSRERQNILSNVLEEFRHTQRSSFISNAGGGGLRTGSDELVKNERTNVYNSRWDVTLKGDTFTTTYRSDAEHSESATHKSITNVYKWLSKRTKMK